MNRIYRGVVSALKEGTARQEVLCTEEEDIRGDVKRDLYHTLHQHVAIDIDLD
jgi:hypothetical protein